MCETVTFDDGLLIRNRTFLAPGPGIFHLSTPRLGFKLTREILIQVVPPSVE